MSTYETVDPEAQIRLDGRGLRRTAQTLEECPQRPGRRHLERRRATPPHRGRTATWSSRADPTTWSRWTCVPGRWPACALSQFGEAGSELKAFDLVDANISFDPERDDLAHPEAVSITGFPEVVGSAPEAPGAAPPQGPGRPERASPARVRGIGCALLGVPRHAAFARSRRARARPACCSAARPTTRPGLASDGRGATTGFPWRTTGPSRACGRPDATSSPARTWPPRSASGRDTCWSR